MRRRRALERVRPAAALLTRPFARGWVRAFRAVTTVRIGPALRGGLVVMALCCLQDGLAPRIGAQRTAPLVSVETTVGTFTFETFVKDAPVSVHHIIELVKAGFYDGQRVHRAVPGLLVQFGDPQTRDVDREPLWGKGVAASSGKPIGVAEVNLKRKNIAMAVGLAHAGEPAQADSQLYILLEDRPELDGQYAVIGQVVEGGDLLARLRVGDQIRRVFVTE